MLKSLLLIEWTSRIGVSEVDLAATRAFTRKRVGRPEALLRLADGQTKEAARACGTA
jgi:hypothetical protein